MMVRVVSGDSRESDLVVWACAISRQTYLARIRAVEEGDLACYPVMKADNRTHRQGDNASAVDRRVVFRKRTMARGPHEQSELSSAGSLFLFLQSSLPSL